jgi:hypothetical protein
MRRLLNRLILGAIIGLVFAGLRALPFFFSVKFPKAMRKTIEIINFPGIWTAHAWSDLAGLPTGGELGRQLILPSLAIIAQWILIIVLVCLLLGRKQSKSGWKAHTHVEEPKR